jgi:sugar phosphate isomerase/epimerase
MNRNELGIFAKTFARPTLDANLDAVAAHGLGVVQYNMACAGLPSMPKRIAPDLAQRIRVAAAARGVHIVAVSGTFNMIDPVVERRRSGLRRLRELAGACATLGTSTVTLCTGTRDPDDMWRAHPANGTPDAWADLLEAMVEALAIAEEFDLQLAVEPETANVVDSAAKARLLLQELRSPRLKIIIDPANLCHAEDLPQQRDILDEAFDLLAPHIVIAHAKDVRVEDGVIRHVAAGRGLLDYEHYLALLRHVPVPLIVHGLAETEVGASLAFLRALGANSDRTTEKHTEMEMRLCLSVA